MTELIALTPTGLAHRCRTETDRYFHGQDYDPAFCLELFRRALSERDSEAWEFVFFLYAPLVKAWILRHPSFAQCAEEAQYFINRAFERMWHGLTPEKFQATAQLPALMEYLKLCVHSSVIDHIRKLGPAPLPEETLRYTEDPRQNFESKTADRIDNRALWEMLKSKMNGEQEEKFFFAYFSLGLKPQQILREFPKHFANVQDVYRTRENILDRLRRDPDLVSFKESFP